MPKMFYSCLVCAYPKLKEPPRSPSGGGSYEICPACGYQYGVDDDDRGITPEQWRATWVKHGAKWTSVKIKPPQGWPFQPPTTVKPRPVKNMEAKETTSVKKKSSRPGS